MLPCLSLYVRDATVAAELLASVASRPGPRMGALHSLVNELPKLLMLTRAAEVSLCRNGARVDLHGINYFGFEVGSRQSVLCRVFVILVENPSLRGC